MTFKINVNNSQWEVQEGELLLHALRRNGIKVPTLCYMHGFSPSGACRLCVVEVEGKRDLITSCTYPVEPDMVVKTNSMRVIKARKSIVEMLLSNHPDDCLYCERNGNCELQWLAEEMNIKERKYYGEKNSEQRDHSSPSVYRDPEKCVLCNRCVRVCEEVQLVTALEFISRGNKTRVNSAFSKGLNVSSCINCGQCIMVCPTGALVDISHIEKVQAAIEHPQKQTHALVSPAFVASVSDYFNLKPADNPIQLIATALHKMGFDRISDMGWTYDLNISLEARQLFQNLSQNTYKPLFSSCCPAWIKYAEVFTPQMLDHISPVKSPQQVMGRLVKHYHEPQNQAEVYTVSFMPCVANKFEAAREENTQKGISEIDAVITVREFLRMLRSYGIDLQKQEPFQNVPFSKGSAAGYKMTYSGGKAETVALQLDYLINGDKNHPTIKFSPPKNPTSKKEVKLKIGKYEVGFAWVSGIAEAQEYLDTLKAEGRKDIHYIEIMACQGGCVGGGGQPVNLRFEKIKQRKKISQEFEKQKEFDIPGQNQELENYYRVQAKKNNFNDLYIQFRKRDVIK